MVLQAGLYGFRDAVGNKKTGIEAVERYSQEETGLDFKEFGQSTLPRMD